MMIEREKDTIGVNDSGESMMSSPNTKNDLRLNYAWMNVGNLFMGDHNVM